MQNLAAQLTGSEPVSEQIYKALKDRIISGRMGADEIHTEVSIANEFGASRTPAREALRRLEAEDFLQIVPRKGYRVCSIHCQDILDIYDIAIALEPMSAFLAAKNRSSPQLEELRKISFIADTHEDSPYSADVLRLHSQLNRDLHVLIAQASGNQYLVSYVTAIHEKLLMHEAYYTNFIDYLENEERWNLISHASICKAIENRDSDLAEFLMRRHFIKSKQTWMAAMSIHKRSES